MDNRDQQEMRADHGGSSRNTTGPVHLTKPLYRLCHMPSMVRTALKMRSITTCDRLLATVGRYEDRERFAHDARIPFNDLTILVRRADLARVRGLGWVFRSMLEDLDVADIATLAHQDSHKVRGLAIAYAQQSLQYSQAFADLGRGGRLYIASPTPSNRGRSTPNVPAIRECRWLGCMLSFVMIWEHIREWVFLSAKISTDIPGFTTI